MISGIAPSNPYPTSILIFLSSIAAIINTPLFVLAFPMPQSRNNLLAYSSIGYPSNVGRSTTAIWFELLSSSATSFCSKTSSCSFDKTLALSVTNLGGLGLGNTSCACIATKLSSMSQMTSNFFIMFLFR